MQRIAGQYILNFDKCNQHCIFCMKSPDIEKKNVITFEIARKEILYAKKRGYKNVDFFGGEPTVFLFLARAIRLVNDLGMEATLATNAVKFASRGYSDNFFKNISLAGVRTTLHSHKRNVHDLVTQKKNSFNDTSRGIKNILKNCKKLSVNIVITALNYRDLPEIVNYIHKLGVRGVKFSGLSLKGKASLNNWLMVEVPFFEPYLIKAVILAKKLGFLCIEAEKMPKRLFIDKKMQFVRFIGEE